MAFSITFILGLERSSPTYAFPSSSFFLYDLSLSNCAGSVFPMIAESFLMIGTVLASTPPVQYTWHDFLGQRQVRREEQSYAPIIVHVCWPRMSEYRVRFRYRCSDEYELFVIVVICLCVSLAKAKARRRLTLVLVAAPRADGDEGSRVPTLGRTPHLELD